MSDATATRSVGVVIPVYNRGDVLMRTLASLQAQSYPATSLEVVVADDGSEEDIGSLLESWDPPFPKLYVRQDHHGFGAARARNLGASHLNAETVIFLDSDGIVGTDFVERHNAQHRAGQRTVVIGGRVHLQAGEITPEALAAGVARLESADKEEKEDFRAVLARRTAHYQSTDEGFRAFVSSNVSMPKALFDEVRGFDERFRWWGSEDTELGWRLWQAGAQFIDDPSNRIYHQLDLDTAGGAEGRKRARDLNRGLLSSLVPHRFYRSGMPDPRPEIPKFSVLVHDVPQGAPQEIWKALETQTLPDFEVIFIAAAADHDPFAGSAEGEPRCRFVTESTRAVMDSRGEYLLILNGHSAQGPTLLQNLRKRLDQRPAAHAMTFGVDIPGEGLYGRREDLEALDVGWKTDLPTAVAVRRRALILELSQGGPLEEALAACRTVFPQHTSNGLIAMPGASRCPRPDDFNHGKGDVRLFWDEALLGPGPAFKAGLKMGRKRLRPPPEKTPAPSARKPVGPAGIRYVGWVGKDNLGDEAMLQATRALLPWGAVEARGEARHLLLLGGGTLINRGHYLKWLQERDSPRLERAVLGTGVASPAFWGRTEAEDEWVRWLGTCGYVGVRGPRSAQTLSEWGYKGSLEVCGDPALALEAPEVSPEEGSVLIAPAWTSGESWGHSDDTVYSTLADAAKRWIGEGRKVVLMSCHPSDDRPILEMRERLGSAPTGYVAGYLDVQQSLSAVASSELIVGERLHACVLAAAAGRPFLAVEYRPKLRDFADSVAMGEYVIRTDALTLEALFERVEQLSQAEPYAMRESVSRHRQSLQAASDLLRTTVGA